MTATWIKMLAQQCEARSQAAVAAEIGMSASTVNQILKGTYKASTTRIEARVRGRYMAETVACPVLGDIPKNECLDHQRRDLAITNPIRVRLSQTCPTCPNNHKQGGDHA